ncbi:MAG: hypothetical protein ACTHM8_09005, partial [Sphingomonas sp.]
MTHRHIIAGSALAGLAALSACQQPHGAADDASAGNASKTVFGAPAPTPKPSASPTATPSPRSIMQPDVIEQPIVPPPPMPF